MISRNKKGMELAANMIVVLVLAAATLAMGLSMSGKFFDKADKMRTNIDQQTNERIRGLLDDGSLVVNPLNRLDIKHGTSGVYAIGISNQLKTGGASDTFTITISAGDVYKTDGSVNTDINSKYAHIEMMTATNSLQTVDGTHPLVIRKPIQKNQKDTIIVAVNVDKDADRGTHIYDVEVKYMDGATPETYGNSIYKLYLNVV